MQTAVKSSLHAFKGWRWLHHNTWLWDSGMLCKPSVHLCQQLPAALPCLRLKSGVEHKHRLSRPFTRLGGCIL